MNNKNPIDHFGWTALSRESALVRHLLGSGATALGRANYADQVGEYYTAFFNLSIGLERLAKLILIIDFSLSNNGKLPSQTLVRKFGHHLAELMNLVEKIQHKHSVELRFLRPDTKISRKIIDCLDSFADAGRGRYANYAALGDPNLEAEFEPIRKWWTEVAELILEAHFYGKPIQNQVEKNARIVDEMAGRFSSVFHINETGEIMQDILSASTRTGQTKLVQKYGRYYTLTVVRWLSDLFSELSDMACYRFNMPEFFGHSELFHTYTVEDRFLKTRTIWPLK